MMKFRREKKRKWRLPIKNIKKVNGFKKLLIKLDVFGHLNKQMLIIIKNPQKEVKEAEKEEEKIKIKRMHKLMNLQIKTKFKMKKINNKNNSKTKKKK